MICPLCHHRKWPIWAILVVSLLLLAKDTAQTGFAFIAGRWYEQGGPSRAWQTLANDMVNMETKRQLEGKGRR